MRRVFALALIGLLFPPAVVQAEPVDYEMVTRIRHEGLNRSQVMNTLRGLIEQHGPRLTGSPALRAASDWSRERFDEWGLHDARLEPVEFGQGWSFSSTHVREISPFEGPLRALPPATIMASFLYHAAMRSERFPRKPMPQQPLSGPLQSEPADAESEPGSGG